MDRVNLFTTPSVKRLCVSPICRRIDTIRETDDLFSDVLRIFSMRHWRVLMSHLWYRTSVSTNFRPAPVLKTQKWRIRDELTTIEADIVWLLHLANWTLPVSGNIETFWYGSAFSFQEFFSSPLSLRICVSFPLPISRLVLLSIFLLVGIYGVVGPMWLLYTQPTARWPVVISFLTVYNYIVKKATNKFHCWLSGRLARLKYDGFDQAPWCAVNCILRL